jgi:hypothetical protein
MCVLLCVLFAVGLGTGCGKGAADTGDGPPTGRVCVDDPDWGENALCTDWFVNTEDRSTYIVDTSGVGVWTDVQGVEIETSGGAAFARVQTTGIPRYTQQFDKSDVAWLNARPLAADDFSGGETTAVVGEVLEFGQDIGLR